MMLTKTVDLSTQMFAVWLLRVRRSTKWASSPATSFIAAVGLHLELFVPMLHAWLSMRVGVKHSKFNSQFYLDCIKCSKTLGFIYVKNKAIIIINNLKM